MCSVVQRKKMEAQKRLNNLQQILSRSLKFQPALPTTVSSLPSSQTSLSTSGTSSVEVQTTTPCHRCSLTVTPAVGQFDQPVRIRVRGLSSHAKVTLQGWSHSRWYGTEVVLVSHGHFYTDQQGNLDLDNDPSLGGTYTGVDPMGLFWSMAPLPDHPQDVRLVIRDVTKPLVINIAVFDGHVAPSDDTVAMTSRKPLCITEVRRTYLAPGVRRIEVREGVGVLATTALFSAAEQTHWALVACNFEDSEGAHPGVIDMFGAAGGIMEIRAALLAAHGFAVMALAFFNFEDLPKEMNDLRLEYFQEAVEWLSSHPSVQPTGIGVVGVSAGGTQALLMAMICPQVKAVVEINGHTYQILYDLILNGHVFQQEVPVDLGKIVLSEKEGYSLKDISNPTDADIFPVWKSQAHILCLVCEDDQLVAWKEAEWLRDLYPGHKRHLIDVVVYPGAGHLLEPPYTPHCRYCINPAIKENVVWGGRPKDHAVAQLDAWHRILAFLHTWLGNAETPHTF